MSVALNYLSCEGLKYFNYIFLINIAGTIMVWRMLILRNYVCILIHTKYVTLEIISKITISF